MKTIVFDFDKTLATNELKDFWKTIWKTLGYDVGKDSIFQTLKSKYHNGEISYKTLNHETFKYFLQSYLNETQFSGIIHKIKLNPGLRETLKYLKLKNCKICLISGGISNIIRDALGNNIALFDEIKANYYMFDEYNELEDYYCNFDNAGKAKYVQSIIKQADNEDNIIFVGNANNINSWAKDLKCKTLCVNPDKKCLATNKNRVINDVSNMTQILPTVCEMLNIEYVDKNTLIF